MKISRCTEKNRGANFIGVRASRNRIATRDKAKRKSSVKRCRDNETGPASIKLAGARLGRNLEYP